MKEVYLVIQYEDRFIYLPFRDLISVDDFTETFDNLLELAASVNDYLSLGFPNQKILDVYLSESVAKITDDSQAYDKRYLEVKYSRDNFISKEVEKSFISYLKSGINRVNEQPGLKIVFDNYCKKYVNGKKAYLEDKDIERIALLYLSDNYKRHKDIFFKLRDRGYKMKIHEFEHDYTKIKEKEEADKMLLSMVTGMNMDELKAFVLDQSVEAKNYGIRR